MDELSPKHERKRSNAALVIGLIVVVLIAGGLAFAAFSGIGNQTPTPIGEILADLRTYDEQLVLIEGQVSTPMNLLGRKIFTLTDDSGQITVVTERGLPSSGSEVQVQGHVKQLFEVAGVQMTVVFEANSAG